MTRNWHLGEPGWSWPDDVDKTGTENRPAHRYLPVLNTERYAANVIREWEVARVFVDEEDAEMRDDARLIAAAPRLLETLETLVAAADNTGCDGCTVLPQAAIDLAQLVIAEAKGESMP
jgi:hypothetical protein